MPLRDKPAMNIPMRKTHPITHHVDEHLDDAFL